MTRIQPSSDREIEDATLEHPLHQSRETDFLQTHFSVNSENAFYNLTKVWEEHQKQHHFLKFPGLSPT